MRRGALHALRLARGGPVAQAVARRAQVRPALDDAPRVGLARQHARRRVGLARIARHAARAGRPVGEREEVGRPLPHVPGHVHEAVAVGGVAADGRGAGEAVLGEVLPGEPALPGVRHVAAPGRELVAPGVDRPLQPPARGVLPLRLGGQRLARPRRVGLGVAVGDLGHGVVLAAVHAAPRPLGRPPGGPGHPRPPVAHLAEVDRPVARLEDHRPGHQQRRIGARIVGGVRRDLGVGQVPRLLDERGERGHRHRRRVHPEPVHRDGPDRRLLGIEVLRPHGELAARDPAHPRCGGRRRGGRRWRGAHVVGHPASLDPILSRHGLPGPPRGGAGWAGAHPGEAPQAAMSGPPAPWSGSVSGSGTAAMFASTSSRSAGSPRRRSHHIPPG